MNVSFLKKGVVSLSVLSMLVQPLAYAGPETTSNQSIEVLKSRSPIDVMFENYMTEGEVTTATLAAMVVDFQDGVNTPAVYSSRRDELRGYVRNFLIENKGGTPADREKIQQLEITINTYIQAQQKADRDSRLKKDAGIVLGFTIVGGTIGSVLSARAAAQAEKLTTKVLAEEAVDVTESKLASQQVVDQVEVASENLAASNPAAQAAAKEEVSFAQRLSGLYARLGAAIRSNPNAEFQTIVAGIEDLVGGAGKISKGVLTAAANGVKELFAASTSWIPKASPMVKAVRSATKMSFIRETEVNVARTLDFQAAVSGRPLVWSKYSDKISFVVVQIQKGKPYMLLDIAGEKTLRVDNKWAILAMSSRHELKQAAIAGRAKFVTYVQDGKVTVKAIHARSALKIRNGLEAVSTAAKSGAASAKATYRSGVDMIDPYVNSGLALGAGGGAYVGIITAGAANVTFLSSPLDNAYGKQLPRFKELLNEINGTK